MHLFKTATLLLVALLAINGAVCSSDAVEDAPIPVHEAKAPMQWSSLDVESWMNFTVGYPEYSVFVKKHVIDGPTLMAMNPEDFEDAFPITHSIHLIKLRAHLTIVQGKCICAQEANDFWSYLDANSLHTRLVGLAFLPRSTLLYTFALDGDVYSAALGGEDGSVSLLSSSLFWLLGLLAPNVFLMGNAVRFVTTNYITMPLFIVHCIMQQYNEVAMFLEGYRRFTSGTPILAILRASFGLGQAIPLVMYVLSWVLPSSLLQVVIIAFLAYCLFLAFGTAAMIFNHFFPEKKGEQEQKQQ